MKNKISNSENAEKNNDNKKIVDNNSSNESSKNTESRAIKKIPAKNNNQEYPLGN
ncbi:hypothetical protein [Flavobacterium sp.]|uniref:hypothetical protein n=1 Tax=Flavobacterium sp. TaxID=239 RepID=UPI00374D1AAE